MRKWIRTACLLFAPAALLGQSAPAASPSPAAPPPWEARLSLSFNESRGNSVSATRGAELDLTRNGKDWTLGSSISVQRGSASGDVHTDRRFGDLWLQRSLGKRFSLVAGGELYRNRPAGKDLRTFGGIGITGTLVQRPSWQLTPSLKVGRQNEDFTSPAPSDSFHSLRIEAQGEVKLSGTTTFTHDLTYSRDLDHRPNTEVTADLGIQADITKSLSLQVGYDVEIDRVPAAGKEERDSSVSVSLVFDLAKGGS